MASFLDNTGDIVLDAVLTDYGRQLLAKGDGSFNITKFALGDDEIDYQLYDLTASAATADTNILNTPILEAFTNNAASMKSKLLTINIENLLYLPIIKLNTSIVPTGSFENGFTGYVIPVFVDETNDAEITSFKVANASAFSDGVIAGSRAAISFDQGLDNANTSKTVSLLTSNPELYEREYNVYLDSRLAMINGQTPLSIDDDGIAVYRFTGDNTNFVNIIDTNDRNKQILGNQGSRLNFSIVPKEVLRTTDTYFQSLGSSTGVSLIAGVGGSATHKTIRSSVTVEGITTGYSIDVPILFAKKA